MSRPPLSVFSFNFFLKLLLLLYLFVVKVVDYLHRLLSFMYSTFRLRFSVSSPSCCPRFLFVPNLRKLVRCPS
ncbi:hypothetical protein BKA57DRAFT_462598 [Linnemannia elongata]|nr:hypothetical protein BKA57DRAFT_462598 [Linnemannia elongata]